MNRFDVALNKKSKKKFTLFSKSKKQKEDSKYTPIQPDTGKVPPSSQGLAEIVVKDVNTHQMNVGISTSTVGIGTIPQRDVSLLPSTSSLPFGVFSQSEVLSTQGPTSQHVVIAGPDGYRLVIPIRMLRYSITRDPVRGTSDITFTIPSDEASRLRRDIQGGIERQERNRRL